MQRQLESFDRKLLDEKKFIRKVFFLKDYYGIFSSMITIDTAVDEWFLWLPLFQTDLFHSSISIPQELIELMNFYFSSVLMPMT